LLLAICGPAWAERPTVLPPLILSLALLAAPFFVMQPGMGAGIAGHGVVTGSAVEYVVAASTSERIVTGPAVQRIVAAAAVERVITLVSIHRVGGVRAGAVVVAWRAFDYCHRVLLWCGGWKIRRWMIDRG
jgi:hypothetical protein